MAVSRTWWWYEIKSVNYQNHDSCIILILVSYYIAKSSWSHCLLPNSAPTWRHSAWKYSNTPVEIFLATFYTCSWAIGQWEHLYILTRIRMNGSIRQNVSNSHRCKAFGSYGWSLGGRNGSRDSSDTRGPSYSSRSRSLHSWESINSETPVPCSISSTSIWDWSFVWSSIGSDSSGSEARERMPPSRMSTTCRAGSKSLQNLGPSQPLLRDLWKAYWNQSPNNFSSTTSSFLGKGGNFEWKRRSQSQRGFRFQNWCDFMSFRLSWRLGNRRCLYLTLQSADAWWYGWGRYLTCMKAIVINA